MFIIEHDVTYERALKGHLYIVLTGEPRRVDRPSSQEKVDKLKKRRLEKFEIGLRKCGTLNKVRINRVRKRC